jgi:hypothetical protein
MPKNNCRANWQNRLAFEFAPASFALSDSNARRILASRLSLAFSSDRIRA